MNEVRELRLAVSMVGGTSLAVHIHGSAQELQNFARKKGIYDKLARWSGSKPVIDILSGTSAGGINAVLLAAALTNGTDMKVAESVFKERADIDLLLHPMNGPGGCSILQGNEVLKRSLEEVFEKLLEGGDEPRVDDMDLLVTGTFLQGFPQTYFDQAGGRIYSKQHAGVFHFRKRPAQVDDFDQSKNPNTRHRLVRAARTTCSLPAVFEVSDVAPTLYESDIIQLPQDIGTIWMGDGGYLNNRPLDLVIKSISRKPVSNLPVSRKNVLVEPAPDPFEAMIRDEKGPHPLKHVFQSQSIAGKQSLYSLLERVDQHNRNVEKIQRALKVARDSFQPGKEVGEHQITLFAETCEVAIVEQLREVWGEKMGVRAKSLVGGNSSVTEHAELKRRSILLNQFCDTFQNEVLGQLVEKLKQRLLNPGEQTERNLGSYDVLAVKRKLVRVIDHVYEKLQAKECTEQDRLELGKGLERLFFLHEQAELLTRDAEKRYGNAVRQEGSDWHFHPEVFKEEAKLTEDQWKRIEEELADLNVPKIDLGDEKDFHVQKLDQYLQALYENLNKRLSASEHETSKTYLLMAQPKVFLYEYLTWLDIHTFPVEYAAGLSFHHPVDIVMIDPHEDLGLSGTVAPADKVAGDTLLKFGGFLSAAWRQNDILWGRLDTSAKLIRVMMDPEHLKARWGQNPEQLWSEVCEYIQGEDGQLSHLRRHDDKDFDSLIENAKTWNKSDKNWLCLCDLLARYHHLDIVASVLPELLVHQLTETRKWRIKSGLEEIAELPAEALRELMELKNEEPSVAISSADKALQSVSPSDRARILKSLNFGSKSIGDLPLAVNLKRAFHFGWSTLKALRHSEHEAPLRYFKPLLRILESALRTAHWFLEHPRKTMAIVALLGILLLVWLGLAIKGVSGFSIGLALLSAKSASSLSD